MENSNNKHMLPWIIVGISLSVILACILALAVGAGGLALANRLVRGVRAEQMSLAASLTPQTAALQDLQGYVEVKGKSGLWAAAEPDMLLAAGDSVRAGSLSSASLLFNDGSRAILKAGSEIRIDELDAQAGGKPRTILMTQVSGESTHQVIPNQREGSRYEVLTPSGSGLAKGTEFTVIVTPVQTAYFYVVEGVVAVQSVETTVLVNPGFMTVIYRNQPPIAPVQTVAVEGVVSQAGPQWTVAGASFTADADTVITGEPQVGDWAMVKGHLNAEGQNVADWVVLLRRSAANHFSLTGTVEAIDAGQWTVNGQTITVTETTEHDAAIAAGDIVYVQGLIQAGGVLEAVKIERLDQEEGMPFALTGIVETINGSQWVISGVQMQTGEETSITEGLKPGDLVRTEGHIAMDGKQSGAWLAEEITLVTGEESGFAFTGELEGKDPWQVAGIGFETGADTVIPADLTVGVLVRVEGAIAADGTWIASKIERIDPDTGGTLVLIGTVIATDPWVISGIPVTFLPGYAVPDGITAGMLVRVDLALQSDGTWLVIKIEPLSVVGWFPGCMDITATVIAVDGDQIQLLNWPLVTLAEGATVEGTLTPGSVVRMRVCFSEDMIIQITYIIIVQPGEIEPPEVDEGGKVLVCHKPGGKKGGHTLSISRSALPAHLGHGDYEGSCR